MNCSFILGYNIFLMRTILFLYLLGAFSLSLSGQSVIETKNWCLSRCDLVGDEKTNAELIYLKLANDSIKNYNSSKEVLRFPLRLGIVQRDSLNIDLREIRVRNAIHRLNQAFKPVGIAFFIDRVDVILSGLYIEDLSENLYQPYNDFSDRYDLDSIISIYIFDHKKDFCTVTPVSIRCGRTGGFSYVLSSRTHNIVMSRFDLSDQKIMAHEFGHFFGLYHTFEERQFGKDHFNTDSCALTGDRICDTPPDPGAVFEIYVNYSDCEMLGFINSKGQEYKPLIDNYMSYYKPCYLKEYHFTPGQIEVMRTAARSEIRAKFSR